MTSKLPPWAPAPAAWPTLPGVSLMPTADLKVRRKQLACAGLCTAGWCWLVLADPGTCRGRFRCDMAYQRPEPVRLILNLFCCWCLMQPSTPSTACPSRQATGVSMHPLTFHASGAMHPRHACPSGEFISPHRTPMPMFPYAAPPLECQATSTLTGLVKFAVTNSKSCTSGTAVTNADCYKPACGSATTCSTTLTTDSVGATSFMWNATGQDFYVNVRPQH